ncbi:ion channel [Clostridium chromiireducens]|uniref:ion channel n=1 Tax=Clostridium chromiireducens TaxID=225345 RepID=UPI003AF77EBD
MGDTLAAVGIVLIACVYTGDIFSRNFKDIGKRKGSTIKSFISLLILAYTLFTFAILPMRINNITHNTREYILLGRNIIGAIFMLSWVLSLIISENKIISYLAKTLALLVMPLMAILSNAVDSYVNLYIKYNIMISVYNIVLLVTAVSISVTIIYIILKAYKEDYKKMINLNIFMRYIFIDISAFALFYFLFMAIDLSQIYAATQINDISPTLNFLKEASGFSVFDYIGLIVNAVYFSLVTFSTIGFGDITPLGYVSKLVVCCQIISMMVLMYIGINIALNKDKK